MDLVFVYMRNIYAALCVIHRALSVRVLNEFIVLEEKASNYKTM